MRMRWKLLGLAGIAGVAATGAVAARNRRVHNAYDPDALRDRLHERLAEAGAAERDGSADAASLSPDVPPTA